MSIIGRIQQIIDTLINMVSQLKKCQLPINDYNKFKRVPYLVKYSDLRFRSKLMYVIYGFR